MVMIVKRKAIKKLTGDSILSSVNGFLLLLVAFIMLLPLLNVLSVSLSSPFAVDRNQVFLYPVGVTLASWRFVFGLNELWVSAALNVFVTVVGTAIALVVNTLMAYPLSKKHFPLSKILLYGVVISMIFRAPVIPYFLTLRNIGLIDNIWVLILPHVFAAYNLIIMVTFFRQFPVDLEESAIIDGCGYFRLLGQIIVPCSKAVIGTLALFYAVTIWNQFSHPLMFITSSNLFPLQLRIRQFISAGSAELMGLFSANLALREFNNETIKATVVLFSFIPIACVYPFIQKHFVKGAMLGSVKG